MSHKVMIGVVLLLVLLMGLPLAGELIRQNADQSATAGNASTSGHAAESFTQTIPTIEGSTFAMNLNRLIFVSGTRP